VSKGVCPTRQGSRQREKDREKKRNRDRLMTKLMKDNGNTSRLEKGGKEKFCPGPLEERKSRKQKGKKKKTEIGCCFEIWGETDHLRRLRETKDMITAHNRGGEKQLVRKMRKTKKTAESSKNRDCNGGKVKCVSNRK